jgi:putative ABC transport system permease protein
MLLKKPGFTLVAILMLALGIGANTAIFSVVNAVLLRPLPFKDPDRLLRVFERRDFPQISVAPGNFLDWNEQNRVFEQIAVFSQSNLVLTGSGEPEKVSASGVTTNLFGLLGVSPDRGRGFLPDEGSPGKDRVAVLSHSLWQRRFSSDTSMIGKEVTLDNNLYTVVGIMPSGFSFSDSDVDLWIPLAFSSADRSNHSGHILQSIARLKPGVTLRQAQSDMDTISRRLALQFPETNDGWSVTLIPLHEFTVGDVRRALLILLGAVGFVLLIACANVANLLFAKGIERQKEIAVRVALGAGRVRLIRQLLTESTLLALLGGALGLLLALWGTDSLIAGSPRNIPRLAETHADTQVLAFTAVISLLTGFFFGLLPALQASSPDLNQTLKEGGWSSAGGYARKGVRSMLVISEVTLTLMLMIAAGLMIKSFFNMQKVDFGFNPDRVLTVRVSLPETSYGEDRKVVSFYQQVFERIKALPGVQTVGATHALPLTDFTSVRPFLVEGRPFPPAGKELIAHYRIISPDYFKALGIRLVKGREFSEHDTAESPQVVIVSETLARHVWPTEDPIGRRITVGGTRNIWGEVVGVVRDVRHFGLSREPAPELYWAYPQVSAFPGPVQNLRRLRRSLTLVVRTASDPMGIVPAIRSSVLSVDRGQPVFDARTMRQVLSASLAQPRFTAFLLGTFALVALTLAALGIYGVIAHSVLGRTHEIGIRMALGAVRRDILGLMLRQGMVPVLLGVAIGLTGAFALTRLMSTLLYGVKPADPATYGVISLLVAGVAMLACYIPARRATKVDPMAALRYE